MCIGCKIMYCIACHKNMVPVFDQTSYEHRYWCPGCGLEIPRYDDSVRHADMEWMGY